MVHDDSIVVAVLFALFVALDGYRRRAVLPGGDPA